MADNDQLHSAMVLRDAVEGAGKGMAIGALAGAASRAAKGKLGPGYGAALGASMGLAAGGARAKERILRDAVKEQRIDERWLNRKAFTENRLKKAHAVGFLAGLEKVGFMSALATQVGQKVIGAGTRAASALGQKPAFGNMMRRAAASPLGGKNLARNVGYGVGGLGVAGAGAALAAGSRDR